MKILYIFTFDYSLEVWRKSGILDRELKYFQSLKNKDIDISIVTYGDQSDEEILKDYNIDIIPIYKYFKRPRNKVLRLIKSFMFPFFIKKNVDFDLIKQNQLQGSWVSILLRMISKKPLIMRTGYDVFLFSIKEKKTLYKRILFYILTQISLIASTKYTVTSNDDAKFLNKFFMFGSNKITLRRNWVASPESRIKLVERTKDTVLSVGRIENQKNYFQLIDMFKNSNKKITIIGEGSKKIPLLEYAKQNNVSLEILNPIHNKELIKTMTGYVFYFSSTLFEGNPKTILEAMGSGCIVVVPSSENNKEIIKHKRNGYLYNLTDKSPITYIEDIDFHQLEKISIAAFQSIKDGFSLKKFIEDDLLEYEEALSG